MVRDWTIWEVLVPDGSLQLHVRFRIDAYGLVGPVGLPDRTLLTGSSSPKPLPGLQHGHCIGQRMAAVPAPHPVRCEVNGDSS
jgi:hypothetical protein